MTLQLVQDTVNFWRHRYDWRAEEARLNSLPQFTVSIGIEGFETLDVHFVHLPSSSKDAIPLLFLHGWPGSFAEVTKILPLLIKAGFHVVAPSLPGYGFTSCPQISGFKITHQAELTQKLMSKLGYDEFVVQGGDWGAMIAWTMAVYQPDHVKALHVNLVSVKKPDFQFEPEYTGFEKRSLAHHEWFNEKEFAYYLVQNSKPRTLGFALHDSPVGMLARMADKLFTWSDSYPWSPTELITWTLLQYWPGPTTASQIYRENSETEMVSGPRAKDYLKTPTGVSAFAKEAEMVPRSWAEAKANVVFWKEHLSGGHFAACERPEELAADLSEFYRSVWKSEP